jgi:hypothetical protein
MRNPQEKVWKNGTEYVSGLADVRFDPTALSDALKEPAIPPPTRPRSARHRLAELLNERNAVSAEIDEIDERIAGRQQQIAQLQAQIDQLRADNELDATHRRQHLVPIFKGVVAGIHEIESRRVE